MTRLFIIIASSLLLRLVVPPRIRNALMPWAFGLVLFWQSCATFFGSVLVHFIGVFVYFISVALILDGFSWLRLRKNAVFGAWMLFMGYYLLSSFYGNYGFSCAVLNLQFLIELVFVGYSIGRWIMRREGGFEKLIFSAVISAFIIALVYWRSAADSFSVEAAAETRFDLQTSEEIGEGYIGSNLIGMMACGIFIYPFMYLTEANFRVRSTLGKVLRLGFVGISLWTVLFFVKLIIRTGSRNSILPVLACGLYLMMSRWGRAGDWMRKVAKWGVVIIGFVSLAALIGGKVLVDTDRFRAFDFKTSSSKFNFEDASTGRTKIYKERLGRMRDYEWIIGAGAVPKNARGSTATYQAYAHSIYVHVLNQTGFIGVILFLCFVVVLLGTAFRNSERRRVIILFFSFWALLGVAEAASLNCLAGTVKYLLGMAIAFCGPQEMPVQLREYKYYG